jgi:hypothetical protein
MAGEGRPGASRDRGGTRRHPHTLKACTPSTTNTPLPHTYLRLGRGLLGAGGLYVVGGVGRGREECVSEKGTPRG